MGEELPVDEDKIAGTVDGQGPGTKALDLTWP